MAHSLYIHWPFCIRKCPYCDFNSHLQKGRQSMDYIRALGREIADCSSQSTSKKPILDTVFIGGGTPSLMTPDELHTLLDEVRADFTLSDHCEVTLEANPSSSDREKFQHFKQAGVNRLSLGIQSFNDDELKFLGRIHNAQEAYQALEAAISTFNEVSFDLIYALKDETAEMWEKRLKEALTFKTNHLSLYQLTLEPKTSFSTQAEKGLLVLPTSQIKADLYRITEDLVTQAGFNAYEVSNYAKPGHESRHNLAYWAYSPYFGVGPGAHARITDGDTYRAQKRISNPDKWLSAVLEGKSALDEDMILDRQEMALEALLMGLRLQTGIDKQAFESTTGIALNSILDQAAVQACIDEGYLIENEKSLRTSFEGRLRLEAILQKILA